MNHADKVSASDFFNTLLGLGVVRAFFRLFCSVRCRDAYRAALFERVKGQLRLLDLPK